MEYTIISANVTIFPPPKVYIPFYICVFYVYKDMCLVTEYFMALTGDYYICACGIASSKLLIAQFNTRETSTMRCNGY